MSAAHVVLIPSYNTGARLFETIADVRALGWPAIVVIDGSTDGTGEQLVRMAEADPALLACIQPRNQGKGAAVLHGLRLARAKGFTHALTMDADGQHSAAHVGKMIAESLAHPAAMVLGFPLFDESAPRVRIVGHKIANFCTNIVTSGGGIGDSLFGFRIYPIVPLLEIFQNTSGMRGFDFDSEAAIRSTLLLRYDIFIAMRAASRISNTCATICCWSRCIPVFWVHGSRAYGRGGLLQPRMRPRGDMVRS